MADEFVILNLGTDPAKIGSSYTILGIASTEQAARAMLETMPTSSASKVVILEKKSLIRRVPAVRLESLQEDIVS